MKVTLHQESHETSEILHLTKVNKGEEIKLIFNWQKLKNCSWNQDKDKQVCATIIKRITSRKREQVYE